MRRLTTTTPARRGRLVRVLAALALVPLGLALTAGGALGADDEGDSVGATRTALEKWVENRRLIAKAERDWKLGKQVLEDRIALVQMQIDSLREEIEADRGDIGEADALRDELADQVAVLEEGSKSMAAVVGDYEARARGLLARFPDPLKDNLRIVSQLLPDEGQTEDLPSLSQRFSTVVGLLDNANRFNREVSASSEVRTLPDGSLAYFDVLYVGLGTAFYVNATGTVGGVGRPGPDGWIWEPRPESAPAIAEALKVQKGEQMARFLQLPVELTEVAPTAPESTPAQSEEQDG